MTSYERGQIIGAAKCSVKRKTISSQLSVLRRTVRTTLFKESLRKNGELQPRSGRLQIYSERDKRLILQVVRQFPKFTYQQVCAFTGLKLSPSTLKRILQKHYITT